MSFRTLIIGANGFLGINLTRKLIEEGHFVRGLDIQTDGLVALKGKNIEVVKGSIVDKAIIEKATEDIDIVFSLANAGGTEHQGYYRILPNIESSIHILEVAKEKKHVIYVSSEEAMGVRLRLPADETLPCEWTVRPDPYALWKLYNEILFIAYYRRSKVPTTVIRPVGFLGPFFGRHWVINWVFKPVYLGKEIRLPGMNYEEWKNFGEDYVHVFDLVSALILTMGNEKAFGEVFHIGGDFWLSNHDFFQQGYRSDALFFSDSSHSN